MNGSKIFLSFSLLVFNSISVIAMQMDASKSQEISATLNHIIASKDQEYANLFAGTYLLKDYLLSQEEESGLISLLKIALDNQWIDTLDEFSQKSNLLLKNFLPLNGTPLLYALTNNKMQVVDYLVTLDLPREYINYINLAGKSALEIACFSDRVDPAIVKKLLEKGANKTCYIHNYRFVVGTIDSVMHARSENSDIIREKKEILCLFNVQE